MTGLAWVPVVAGGVVGLAVAVVFLLAVFIGVCFLFGLVKFRYGTRAGARSLDELVGDARYAAYLPPRAPRGPLDQLRAGTSWGKPS
jgi:hypothetical protein